MVIRLILEGRTEDSLNLLAEKYGVSPPKLRVGTVKGRRSVAGCYVAKEKTIYLSKAEVMSNPYVVLHEFYHHLRSAEGKYGASEKHAQAFAIDFMKWAKVIHDCGDLRIHAHGSKKANVMS